MVKGVNNIQTQRMQKQDTAGRNATIAGTIGLVGGGTAGYMTKQIYKDNKFTDEFIKEIGKQHINSIDITNDQKKFLKDFLIKNNPRVETIKKFLNDNKENINDKKIFDETIDDFLKRSDNDMLNRINELREAFSDEVLDAISDFSESFDENKKKFISSDKFKNEKSYQTILKAQKNVKGKASIIWGVATGAVLGIGTFIASKVGRNKQA